MIGFPLIALNHYITIEEYNVKNNLPLDSRSEALQDDALWYGYYFETLAANTQTALDHR
jgi:hypothetical protein